MNNSEMHLPESDWEMIARYLDGTSTPQEAAAIERKISEDEAYAAEFKRIQTIWTTSRYRSVSIGMLSDDTCKDWQKIARMTVNQASKDRLGSPAIPRLIQRRYIQAIRIAAIFIFTILSSVFITYIAVSPSEVYVPEIVFREIQTDRNQRVNLLLSDGTGVSLSVESHLRIPEKFAPDVREVELKGEARFDVAHSPSQPFIIRSGDVTIEVLGTDFGVRAYDNEDRIDVVVRSGSVAVARTDASTPERVVLAPGQLVSVYRSTQQMQTRWVNPEDYMSWMSGRMKFHEAPFEYVIRQLERWYDIEIKVSDESINGYMLTALLDMRSQQNVFEVISQSLKLHYTITDQVVFLYLADD